MPLLFLSSGFHAMYSDQYCVFALLRQAEVLQDHSREQSRINPNFCSIIKDNDPESTPYKRLKDIITLFARFSDTFVRANLPSLAFRCTETERTCVLLL